MSTHASLLIRDHEHEVRLYRHYDGNPAECGADVGEILAGATGGTNEPTAFDLANRFFRRLMPPEKDCPARPRYELSDGLDCVDHFYLIDVTARSIGLASKPSWDSGDDADDWTEHLQRHTIQEFIAVVNRDRVACNERLAEFKREHPVNAGIQQMQPMPMLTL
jgi:hypothetical protein